MPCERSRDIPVQVLAGLISWPAFEQACCTFVRVQLQCKLAMRLIELGVAGVCIHAQYLVVASAVAFLGPGTGHLKPASPEAASEREASAEHVCYHLCGGKLVNLYVNSPLAIRAIRAKAWKASKFPRAGSQTALASIGSTYRPVGLQNRRRVRLLASSQPVFTLRGSSLFSHPQGRFDIARDLLSSQRQAALTAGCSD